MFWPLEAITFFNGSIICQTGITHGISPDVDIRFCDDVHIDHILQIFYIGGHVIVLLNVFSLQRILPQHGFARNFLWELFEVNETNEYSTEVRLQLKSSAESLQLWPYRFDSLKIDEFGFVDIHGVTSLLDVFG